LVAHADSNADPGRRGRVMVPPPAAALARACLQARLGCTGVCGRALETRGGDGDGLNRPALRQVEEVTPGGSAEACREIRVGDVATRPPVEPWRSSICLWSYQRSPCASRRVGVRVLGRIAAVAGHVGDRQGQLFRYTSSRPRTDLRFPLHKFVTRGPGAQTLRSVDGSSSLDLNRLRALTVGKIDSQARPPPRPDGVAASVYGCAASVCGGAASG
jgi:hypothetical protein